ncbi:hypothetical protein DBA29_22705 [Xenophilus aerolatus]|nr:hypothetical protein [Xenophilus aerolatus]
MPALRGATSRTVRIRHDAILVHLGAPNPEPVRRSGREGIDSLVGHAPHRKIGALRAAAI